MTFDVLGQGTVIRIYDHSTNPRELLRELADSILELRVEQWLPVVHVRRGWLHGSHVQLTVRPLGTAPPELDSFLQRAARAAARLDGTMPTRDQYLSRAAELARWENVDQPLLPLRPQGFAEAVPVIEPADWPPGLVLARDQIMSAFLDGILRAAHQEAEVAWYATRVLALLARTHRYGVGIATLPYRSHAEGVSAALGASINLREVFAERFSRDHDQFAQALTEPDPLPSDPLYPWHSALQRAWGIAEALAASHQVDDQALSLAGQMDLPVANPTASQFHSVVRRSGFGDLKPYWQVAHRLILNALYASFTCLGLSPVQRYYACYGLSEAADRQLGESWLERIQRFAAASHDGPQFARDLAARDLPVRDLAQVDS
jgi:hypothetical protein